MRSKNHGTDKKSPSANIGNGAEAGKILTVLPMRLEHDLLGERPVPANAYYGLQTMRAVENFPITGITLSHFPEFIRAYAMVKKACARANRSLSLLDPQIARIIEEACDEVMAGKLNDHFVVDMIQGGAGTSTNMNMNEVLFNTFILIAVLILIG